MTHVRVLYSLLCQSGGFAVMLTYICPTNLTYLSSSFAVIIVFVHFQAAWEINFPKIVCGSLFWRGVFSDKYI